MSAKDYKKFETECVVCKTKFDIWVSMSNFDLGQEEIITKNFYNHCSACRIIEEAKKNKNFTIE